MSPDGGLAQNPTGHGGILQAMRGAGLDSGLLEAGVEELFYFQVDNPLVRLPDPEFLGLHRLRASEMSSKVIPKACPEERLGVPGLIDGRPGVVEYSDLDPECMHARTPGGGLVFPTAPSPSTCSTRPSRPGCRCPCRCTWPASGCAAWRPDPAAASWRSGRR